MILISFDKLNQVAVEELYQNMVLEGPDLSLRLKAAERANARKESVDRNFNVSYGFKAKSIFSNFI